MSAAPSPRRRNRAHALWPALVCLSALAVLPWLLPPAPATAGAAADPALPGAPLAAASAPAVAALPERVATAAVDRSHQVELPDGTFRDALNGAVDAAPIGMYWGPQPWSPIVGIERSSAGIDWFRHEDGSYSTTQMVWRKDLDRYAAMTRVAHPGPDAPAAAPEPAASDR